MRRFTIYVCAAVLIITCGQRMKAEGLHAVRPLAGYACMMLNLTDAQMRDNSLVVPVYAGPSTTSGRVGNASAIVIARSPLHIVNGFAEMLFPNGATVWIDGGNLFAEACVSRRVVVLGGGHAAQGSAPSVTCG